MKLNCNFGQFGGQYVPEVVKKALKELEEAFEKYANIEEFKEEYKYYLKQYVGRPSPLYFAERMTKELGGAKIYLKREDLNHTGAHKINNVIGQVLLAKRMGKKKVIAETGAGQHGVATATCAALFNMKCTVYMGEESMKKQALNVFRMRLLGAEVVPVTYGSKSLKEAVDEAIKQWVANIYDTFYVLGSIVGPHPYPSMVREFQKIIGEEAKEQIMEQEGRLPDALIAAIGGGSNAMGLFNNFFHDQEVELIGVEAAGKGVDTDKHSLALKKGKAAAFHGMKTLFIQNEKGEVMDSYSISAGLDYPGVGPQFAYLKETGRLKCACINDDEAVEAFKFLSEVEGIIPALESSHAVAHAMKIASTMDKDKIIIVNLSGRGDKDVHTVAKYIGEEI